MSNNTKLIAKLQDRLIDLVDEMTPGEVLQALHFAKYADCCGTTPCGHQVSDPEEEVVEKEEKPAGRSRSRSRASKDDEKEEKEEKPAGRSRSRASKDDEDEEKPAGRSRSRSRASKDDEKESKKLPKFADAFDELYDLYEESKTRGLRASVMHNIARKVWNKSGAEEDFEDIEDFKKLDGGGVKELLEVKRLLEIEIDENGN